jgi:hypothetical protein
MKNHKKNGGYFNNVWPLLLVLLFHIGCDNSSKNFTEFLYDLAEIDVENRAAYVDDWLKKQEEFPIIDGQNVYFIFKDKREVAVRLSGDMIAADGAPIELVKIIGTDYYYTLQSFPLNAVFEYKFIVNGRHYLDPLNKRIIKSKDGIRSLLFMPEYGYPVETLMRVNKVYSRMDTVEFSDSDLYIYRHPKAGPDSPLIIFLNGKDYLQLAEANIILDNLISDQQIEPCFAVFPSTDIDAIKMYSFLKKKLALQQNQTIIGGSQKTGLAVLQNPAIFQNFNAFFIQSALTDSSDWDFISQSRALDISGKKIFLGYGYYEKRDSVYSVFIDMLHDKTQFLKYEKYNEGASWLSWKSHLDDALLYLLQKKGKVSL